LNFVCNQLNKGWFFILSENGDVLQGGEGRNIKSKNNLQINIEVLLHLC